MSRSTTAPYPTFAAAAFATSDHAVAYMSLQHELYRGVTGGVTVRFLRDVSTGVISAEFLNPAGTLRLAVAQLSQMTGNLRVVTYGPTHQVCEATFDGWEHPQAFYGVVAYILRAVER